MGACEAERHHGKEYAVTSLNRSLMILQGKDAVACLTGQMMDFCKHPVKCLILKSSFGCNWCCTYIAIKYLRHDLSVGIMAAQKN